MNKLANETSPYLLQHADNPVHWLPWCAESLALAKQHNKPILLSIGYSACHWCHVMAHESFEDQATADIMNSLYINIKVDREERPDLDKIYQTAHSLLTVRPGGWPLTVFLDPEQQMPIFAGTYFPKEPRHGLPSFAQLLTHINDVFHTRQQDITEQHASIEKMLRDSAQHNANPNVVLKAMPLDVARNHIERQFDAQHGGFSAAPKFPQPAILTRGLRHWFHSASRGRNDKRILHTALFTLEKMAMGGIFDHLGGGFFRYSTDTKWTIPHFEKMLYDNGALLRLYSQAWCVSQQPLYFDCACKTADWVMQEMQSAEGGYYCTQDADADGKEGGFYTWEKQQLQSLIEAEDWPVFEARFGLDQAANFENHWHLHVQQTEVALASQFATSSQQIRNQLSRCIDTLRTERNKRTRPKLDDKILTSWNGMMISGMANAGRQLNKPEYIASAKQAANFIHTTLWKDGRLFATTKNGHTQLNAYLDDYAFLLDGLMELLQCEWNVRWLDWAIEIADCLLNQFEDKEHGGFFFTSNDHEQLIQRIKSFADESMPSGNSFAIKSLQRLGYLTGNPDYLSAAENGIRSAWHAINSNALAHCSMLDALEEYLQPPRFIVLRGTDEALDAWHKLVSDKFLPSTLVFNCGSQNTAEEPKFLQDKQMVGDACAYICEGPICAHTIRKHEDFAAYINAITQKLPEKANRKKTGK